MAITIRRMQGGDADELYRLLSDPVVMRYLELPYDRARTEVEVQQCMQLTGTNSPRA